MAWQRLPGASRNYFDTDTGEIISRRQYDKLYGALKKAGLKSYEEKAQKNLQKSEAEQLARPARGRTSIQKLAEGPRQDIVNARHEFKEQKAKTAKVKKAQDKIRNRASRRPKITNRLLKSGRMSQRVYVPLSAEAIQEVVEEARTARVFSYGVGIVGVDEQTGEEREVWFRLDGMQGVTRSIRDDFTDDDYENMVEFFSEYGYLIPVAAFVHLSFEKEYAKQKKETAVRKKRKQIFGSAV